MQNIITCLAFNDQAEEAVNLYVSLFPDSQILNVARFGKDTPGTEGSVMSIVFKLKGQEYFALNGGPHFTFTEGFSLMVKCESQEEVDTLWAKLSEGGKEGPCGWLTDRFGVSWQVVPILLFELLQDENPQKVHNVTQAMLKMSKIETSLLQQAYAQQ